MAGGEDAGTEARADGSGDGVADGDDLEIVLIAAVAANGVIGADGELPWDLPEDMRHFKETTTGHPVIAGRRTFENVLAGLGGPLPDRTNVVLSRSDPDVPEDVLVVESVATALVAAAAAARERGVERAYVMGGAAVYEAFADRADRLVLTEIEEAYEGEVEFPIWPPEEEWTEVEREERDGFAFVTYERSAVEGP